MEYALECDSAIKFDIDCGWIVGIVICPQPQILIAPQHLLIRSSARGIQSSGGVLMIVPVESKGVSC